MPRGGARNRSGPQPDPNSARSEKLGVRFGKLPAAGYTGRLPAWPLTKASTREREVWRQVWRTPQAAAWISEPWRHRTVALYVRLVVRCEETDSPASLHAQLIRYADQIGLTPAGLRENRWEIEEAPGSKAARSAAEGEPAKVPVPPPATPLRNRLKVVDGARGS